VSDRAYELGPREEECDLVMKGGITSGVVYPSAIRKIAGRYRFRNLGGASAGAIAAVAAAACEYRWNQGEPAELSGLLVTVFLREACVAADVRAIRNVRTTTPGSSPEGRSALSTLVGGPLSDTVRGAYDASAAAPSEHSLSPVDMPGFRPRLTPCGSALYAARRVPRDSSSAGTAEPRSPPRPRPRTRYGRGSRSAFAM
jgi:hypothetical protein